MKTVYGFYDIYPKVVQAGQESTITVHARHEHNILPEDADYDAEIFPVETYLTHGPVSGVVRRLSDSKLKVLHLTCWFASEQEYIVKIYDRANGAGAELLEFRIYAVDADLFARSPFKGDLHLHSFHSDGKESPVFVAVSCRKIGLDFMAVTDHFTYRPSLEAQAALSDIDLDFLVFSGEEVHAPDNPVHIVNFGGSYSINELWQDDETDYRKGVDEYEKQLGDIRDNLVRFQVASCQWVFDRIRQAGGLGILCHPYWRISTGYTPSLIVTREIFNRQLFDAYEIISGNLKHEVESNTLQVARYHEERIRGKKIPVVGVSDAHGCENRDLFGWYYTIVFAGRLTQQDIIDSIMDLYSVAVEAIPGESIRIYGPLRLVQFGHFLIREVLPYHDDLCRREGDLLMDYISGNCEKADIQPRLKGNVPNFLNQIYGRE